MFSDDTAFKRVLKSEPFGTCATIDGPFGEMLSQKSTTVKNIEPSP